MQRLIIFALTTLATALGLEVTDPNLWFQETAVLAAVVVATVAFLRKQVALDGIAAVLASMSVGAALGGIGWAAGLFEASVTLVSALVFGLGAGWLGSGGVDAVRSVLNPKAQPRLEE